MGDEREEYWGDGARDDSMSDERMILSQEETQAALDALKPQLALLNKAVEDVMVVLAGEDKES